MKFETSNKIDKWVENHIHVKAGSNEITDKQFVYKFYPNGEQIVKCLCCGEELQVICKEN